MLPEPVLVAYEKVQTPALPQHSIPLMLVRIVDPVRREVPHHWHSECPSPQHSQCTIVAARRYQRTPQQRWRQGRHPCWIGVIVPDVCICQPLEHLEYHTVLPHVNTVHRKCESFPIVLPPVLKWLVGDPMRQHGLAELLKREVPQERRLPMLKRSVNVPYQVLRRNGLNVPLPLCGPPVDLLQRRIIEIPHLHEVASTRVIDIVQFLVKVLQHLPLIVMAPRHIGDKPFRRSHFLLVTY